MTKRAEMRLFSRVDRAFWVLWMLFPVAIWLIADDILSAADRYARMAPDQAACAASLPSVGNFSTLGQAAFWLAFAAEFAVYALLMFLAHRVIRRCARGRVLVAEMIAQLRLIGLVVASWPIADLVIGNGLMAFLASIGDMPGFAPALAPDVTVLGFGLLMFVMAQAMAQAVRLREEADLTI